MTNLLDKYFLRIYQLLKATVVNIPERSKKIQCSGGSLSAPSAEFFTSILWYHIWRKHVIASLFYGQGN